MDITLFELITTYGLAGFILVIAAISIAVLPWRATQVVQMNVAYDALSSVSGSLARTQWVAIRRGVVRLAHFHRRPAAVTRSLV